jgi:hypothetical protein
MDAGTLLQMFGDISDSIWKKFGVEEGCGEWIENHTEDKWFNHDDSDISCISKNDEYGWEVYGKCIWTADGFVMAKVYSGSGEMYCVMMSSKLEVKDEDEWEDLIGNLKEES